MELQNTRILQAYNLHVLLSRSTVEEVNGELISYANLLVDTSTGKILGLTSSDKVFTKEGAISTLVAIKRGRFSDKKITPCLELEQKENLPNAIKESIKKTSSLF